MLSASCHGYLRPARVGGERRGVGDDGNDGECGADEVVRLTLFLYYGEDAMDELKWDASTT